MAEQRRPRAEVITSPQGIAIFPWITRPDTRFNADGIYKTGLKVSGADGEKLKELLQGKFDEAVAAARKEFTANPKNKGKKMKEADPPFKDEYDEDGNETGAIIVSFKLNAQFTDTDGTVITTSPQLFDAKGKKIELQSLYGGSTIRVAFSVHPFYTATVGAGISLRMRAVKVINLVAGGGAGAEAYGFGEEEDGYEAGDFDNGGEDSHGAAAEPEGTPDF